MFKLECIFKRFVTIATECVSEHGKKACEDIGGECITERDGYYYVSSVCVVLGVLSLVLYIIPTARRLQGTLTLSFSLSDHRNNVSFSQRCPSVSGG